MPYYCLECEREHANNYKKHWKYKREALVTRKKEPDLFSEFEKRFKEFEKQVEKYCKDVDMIKNTIGLWAAFMERKDPYWKGTQGWWDWINE